jgi:PAS domain S-box-containing protein
VVERRPAATGRVLRAPGTLERWFGDAACGLAVFDAACRFVRVNPAMARIDGVPVDEHPGRELDDVLPGLAERIEPLLRRVLEGGETIAGTQLVGRTRAEPDRDRRFATAWSPLRGEDGAIEGVGVTLLPLLDADEATHELRVREERMRLAMDGTGTGYWEWEADADRIRWSDSLAILHGLDPGDVPRGLAGFLERIHFADRGAVEARVREALARREELVTEYRTLGPEGGERWLATRARPIPDADGRIAALVGMTADVTDRRRREDALTFLAEAGDALAGSLDPVETLEEIARLAVPRLADWCGVALASDESGGHENVAVAHVDPDKVRWARELQERYPPDPDAPTGAPEVIRTGRSELYPEIDEALLEAAAVDDEQRQLIRDLQMRSAMVVPLRARERTLGAITFIFAESGRQYSTHELELAEELGRRAGLALDHARLYDREHRTAETLQRALLPPTLPRIAGHELAARYLPGREGDHVGGDWYDAFELPDGRFGIAIGDIGGRGITAAALMGQIRNGLRAYALKASGPGAAIGEAMLASAGHLPTLVLDASGGACFTDAPRCPPLGAGADAPCTDHRFTLEPGGAFVLYTDGLVESRTRSLDAGLERLVQVARRTPDDVQRLADEIVEVLPEQRQDDIALLALRRDPTG